MANAPDGCLWVIDMYRELIEGAAFLPPQILKHMDVASGVDRGRIWRIVAAGTNRRAAPRLSKATTADLVALLEHPNGWHRDTAARLLYERQDPSASPALERLASTSHSPLGRTHALFALSGLGRLGPDSVLTALGDREPKVREQALRLAEPLCPRDARVRGRLLAMSDDPDPRVRYQLAFSLGAVPGAEAVPTLAALASRDGADPWMRLAILTSASDRAGELFSRLAVDPSSRDDRHVRLLLLALSGQAAAAGRAEDLAAISRSLSGPLAADRSVRRRGRLGARGPGLARHDREAVRRPRWGPCGRSSTRPSARPWPPPPMSPGPRPRAPTPSACSA